MLNPHRQLYFGLHKTLTYELSKSTKDFHGHLITMIEYYKGYERNLLTPLHFQNGTALRESKTLFAK